MWRRALIVAAAVVAAGLPACASKTSNAELSCVSPNGEVQLKITTDDAGKPQYSVQSGERVAIAWSRLGLDFASRPDLVDGLALTESSIGEFDDSWEQPWGERRVVRSHYRECVARLRDAKTSGGGFDIRVRAFDDGIGFRYEVRGIEAQRAVIDEELTEFAIDPSATALWQPGDDPFKYEVLYRTTRADAIDVAHTPVTFRLSNGLHISVHEAALLDYSAFTLVRDPSGKFVTRLRPAAGGGAVSTESSFHSPWRTVQVSDDAVGLLNSDLVLNLNEPNRLGDVSYIEPGKFAGVWWELHLGQSTWHQGPQHGATTENVKAHIDFAAEHGISGVLVEGWNKGWDGDWVKDGEFSFTEAYPDYDVTAVTSYALERGVRIVGHNETGGHLARYEDQLDDAFALYESLGIRQVKTGYVGEAGSLKHIGDDGIQRAEWHDGQVAVRHHQLVLEKAHAHRIGIITHEPVKDTGLRRTYPNWLSREGSRGQEFAVWGEQPNPPEHEVMLSFTRMLSGPMDYTPGICDLRFKGDDHEPPPVQSTLMKQLALYVVLYSPVQMVPDLPKNYRARPDAFQFIVDVPTDWEQSRALAGELGRYVVIARQERGGDDWYLGAITDESERAIPIRLDFLEGARSWRADIYRDGSEAHWRDNPYDYFIESRQVTRDTTLELNLAAGGGVAIRFSPDGGE